MNPGRHENIVLALGQRSFLLYLQTCDTFARRDAPNLESSKKRRGRITGGHQHRKRRDHFGQVWSSYLFLYFFVIGIASH